MPEMLEIEIYRRSAEVIVGREIKKVRTPDSNYIKGGVRPANLRKALEGRTVVSARRHGKLLILETSDNGPSLGMRFGMTGVLDVDGVDAISDMQYSSLRRNPKWNRFSLEFDEGQLHMRDPRRFGSVELDPDESTMGPDASVVTFKEFRHALQSSAPIKARLMNQAVIAGLGNLLTDELLWRAGVNPSVPSRSLDDAQYKNLYKQMRATLRILGARGGSHMGDLHEFRNRDGVCPKDGSLLCRETVGGRTTYWCPTHQR
jgi:formamidopyrimidine-DNA glycosylase